MQRDSSPPKREASGARALLCSRHFLRSWSRLPTQKRKPLQAKIRLLALSPAHPSLQAYRLMYPSGTIWGCRLSRGMRLLYQFDGGHLYLLDIGRHEIVERLPQRAYLDEQQWTPFP
jgi:mRNA-degrading endonuclease RelE of RelBE toxin-antitoxin system